MSNTMTYTEVVQAEGEYLLALPAIRATENLDETLCDVLPWGDIETFVGYCIDRPSDMPSGSVVNLGFGAQQRSHTHYD